MKKARHRESVFGIRMKREKKRRQQIIMHFGSQTNKAMLLSYIGKKRKRRIMGNV